MGVAYDVIDFLGAFDEVERRWCVTPGAGPCACREKGVHVVGGTKSNRAASVAALDKRYVCEGAKLKALGLLGEKPAENKDALIGDSIGRACATVRVKKEAAKDKEQSDANEGDAPKHEEEWST